MKSDLITKLGLVALLCSPLAAQTEPPATPLPEPTEELQKQKEPKMLRLGAKVPADLTLTDLDGKTLSMKELRGKTVVICWYAIYCPAIKTAEPKLKEMAAQFGKQKDVVMIAINSDKGELSDAKPAGLDKDGNPLKPFPRIRQHMKDKEINFRVFVDPGNKIADYFQAKTTPHMFVMDAEGVLQYSGALDNDPRQRKKTEDYQNYVQDTVQALAAGKKVEALSTKPYG